MLENHDTIRKVLFNEVSLFTGIVGLILGAVFWIQNPQQELENDLVRLNARLETSETIASQLQNIKDNDLHELQRKMDILADNQIKLMERMARIEALLERNTNQ